MTGSFHSSVGQEACAAGVCAALGPADIVTSTHRGHAHAIAKGVSIEAIFAELLGRESGVSGGRGGSMHLHDRPSGFYGENAIVGGGLPWAAGAAWARRRGGRDDVAVAFLGDGAVAQGVTHETLLLARHWSSPTVFVCENNGFAHSMESEHLFGAPGEIARRVEASGMQSVVVDGTDVEDVNQAAESLVARARATGSPAFIECALYRVRPHSVSDADYRYRPKEAGADWLARNDPLARTRRALDPGDAERIDEETERDVKEAFAAAEAAGQTPAANARRHVYADQELQERA
jgi:TPP-dependent pyruvate/acetoin dehydrogenase alpha subunit